MKSRMATWLALALMLTGVTGCGHTTDTHTTDPLVVSKRPIESKAQFKPPSQIAALETTSSVIAHEIIPAGLTVRGQAP